MSTLLWLIGDNEPHENLIQFAVEYGQLEILKYLLNSELRITGFHIRIAIQFHQNHIFEWIIEQDHTLINQHCLFNSIKYGNTCVLKILLEKGYKLDNSTLTQSIMGYDVNNSHNLLQICKLLHEYKFEWNSDYLSYFIQNNKIDIIRWIYENDIIQFELNHYVHAICYSNILTIEWIINNVDIDKVDMQSDINSSPKIVKENYIIAFMRSLAYAANRKPLLDWLNSHYKQTLFIDILVWMASISMSIGKRLNNIPDGNNVY